MRYAAQIQAATEILIDLETNHRPADRVIAYYFNNNRYIGSKDKKIISEVVYGVLRHRGLIDWALERVGAPVKARTRVAAWLQLKGGEKDLREIYSGEKYAPPKLWRTEKPVLDVVKEVNKNKKDMPAYARFGFPQWLEETLNDAYGADLPALMESLNTQAQTDLRTNTLKTTPDDLTLRLAEEGYKVTPAPFVAQGLRLDDPKNLFQLPIFKEGLFEVQDAGSQLIATICGAEPGQKVTDFCAGAGGKTLALAATMANKGVLSAGDVIPQKLVELKKRLKRAGVDNAVLHEWSSETDQWVKRHKNTQDVVLLDVPCSGSGVWRRNPDAKWHLTPERLAELCDIQKNILESASRLVKKGGRLVYATCSILPQENMHQIESFISGENNFKIVPIEEVWAELAQKGYLKGSIPQGCVRSDTLQLTPHKTQTDGFFITILERT